LFLTEWAGVSDFKNSASFRKSANNAPRNAKGSGGKGPNDVHEPKMREMKDQKPRKMDTPQMQTEFKDKKLSSGEWHACSDWKKSYENADKTMRFVKTVEKSEFEVYKRVKKGWKHIGVLRPSEGRVRIGKGNDLNPDGTIGVAGTGNFAKGIIVK
jgi:hypothetical protein